ncbi:MAG TPA: VOC family protein [Bacteroidia bacterium]|jgi:PhnB protein|nr:VOC family protein [Bacteroidia bacterium]
MKTSHVYPGATPVTSYLTFKDCKKAIEFYKKAFGATEKGILYTPDGKVGHAEIEIEGNLLMMADENPEWGNKSVETLKGSPANFGLYVKDTDAAFKKAIAAGAKEVMKVEDMFYGDRTGSVEDPFGFKWMISTHQEDVSFPEMQKRFEKMFEKQKA